MGYLVFFSYDNLQLPSNYYIKKKINIYSVKNKVFINTFWVLQLPFILYRLHGGCFETPMRLLYYTHGAHKKSEIRKENVRFSTHAKRLLVNIHDHY